MNLAPLDMIMWNYKGEVDFGYFPENWEVVSYAQGGAQNTAENYYSRQANRVVSFDACRNKTDLPYPEELERFATGTAVVDGNGQQGRFHQNERELLIFVTKATIWWDTIQKHRLNRV